MSYPALCLLFLTYGGTMERRSYAMTALRCAIDQIRYSGPLFVHIADDGSPPIHREHLRELAGGYKHLAGISVSNSERRGYGANYNAATQHIHAFAKIILPLEDDWELLHELDCDQLVDGLQSPYGIESIRLGYIGFTDHVEGSLVAVGEGQDGSGIYFLFDPENTMERHVSAGHPRIETVAWERKVGPWAEGLGPGETELEWCARPEARKGVAWPMHLTRTRGDVFAHIGTRQSTDLDHDQLDGAGAGAL